MKIKKLGNIILTNSLWWMNYDDVTSIQSETSETIDGGVIVWQQARDVSGENITLGSENDGWQTKAIKDEIKTLISSGATSILTLEDDTTMDVRFRHENNGGAVKFERVVKASLSEYYTCEILLGRI